MAALHSEAPELRQTEHGVQGEVVDVEVHVPFPLTPTATKSIQMVNTVKNTAVAGFQVVQTFPKFNQRNCVGPRTYVGPQ